MAKLTLTGIKCFEQEDWTFDDDIEIIVYSPGRQAVWRNSMDTGQTRDLGGIEVEFEGTVKIQLLEKDFEGDDNLGTVTVSDMTTAAQDREARFTGDDANYTVWYRVSNPATDIDERPDDHDECDHDENPLEEWLEEWLGPYFEWWGGGDNDHPASECPMGNLSVYVEADGQPLQGASVSVREIGRTGTTNAQGIYDAGLVHEGEYTCEATKEGFAPNPGMTRDYVSAQTSNQIDVALGKVKVKEVRPNGNDMRWYINMEPADESKKYGREATIEAEITPKMKGIRVYFQKRYWHENRDPSPEKTVLTTYSALTDENGIAKTKIRFGKYGGDWFRVGARLDKSVDPEVFSAWFQVWRKMFYEITEMDNPAGGSFKMANGVMPIVKSSMQKVYIELSSLGTNVKGVVPHYVENFDGGSGTDDWADNYCSTGGVPWKIHYAVVSTADEKRTEERVFKEVKTASQTLQTQNSAGNWVSYFFQPWQYHGDDWLISAKYREQGSSASWTSLDDSAVTLGNTARTDGYRTIIVNFAGTSVDPTAKTQEVKLKFHRIGGINGWGGTSLHLVICRKTFDSNYSAANLTAAMAGTSIHEPGHSFGLVNDKPWETTDSDHSGHCKFQNCVMWWQGYTGRPHEFHKENLSDPGCHTFVREKDMTKSAMSPRWKFPR
ncbi:MAG: carboxypeptidase-like regulatory domain-containing protein [Planctomycetota bacterium]|jgi:hypothetical protein